LKLQHKLIGAASCYEVQNSKNVENHSWSVRLGQKPAGLEGIKFLVILFNPTHSRSRRRSNRTRPQEAQTRPINYRKDPTQQAQSHSPEARPLVMAAASPAFTGNLKVRSFTSLVICTLIPTLEQQDLACLGFLWR
jgi:hypothetical protein